MDSPVGMLLKAAGITPAAFAREYSYSPGGLYYAISGTYNTLPFNIIRDVEEAVMKKGVGYEAILLEKYGTTVLQTAYSTFQKAAREGIAKEKLYHEPNRWTRTESPVFCFVRDVAGSREGFAKLLKVPPATVMRWEKGETRGMPEVIQKALSDAGYPYMRELIERQRAWREENVA